MKRIWRPIDAIANWIQHELDTVVQQRVAVLLIFASIGLIIYGFWTDEPPLIYQMSALALTLTALGILVGLEGVRTVEEQVEDVAEECDAD
jgi:hypothetical protein